MTEEDAKFYLTLGKRVAELRKKYPMNQTQLAKLLGISQQHMAAHEAGLRKIPACMIPKLSRIFQVSAEQLLGMREKPTKPGPTPKLQQQMEYVNALPRSKRQFVIEMIDAVLQQQQKSD